MSNRPIDNITHLQNLAFDPCINTFGVSIVDAGDIKDTGFVSVSNSTCASLGSNETFVGEWEDTLNYNNIIVGINSDVDSSLNGLKIQWSHDASSLDDYDEFNIIGGLGKVFTFTPARRYSRISYINGITPQTNLNIQSILKKGGIKPSSHRISDSIIGDDDAELVKSVITGLRDDDTFANARVSNSNRLKTVSQPYTYAIAEGDIPDHMAVRRFGHNPNVSTSLETVCPGSILYTYMDTAEYLRIVSDDNDDTLGGTGMQSIFIQGLDDDYILRSEIVELNGTTPVYTTQYKYKRLFAAYGKIAGTAEGNEGEITISNNAGTIIIGILPEGEGRFNAAMFTVPANSTFYMTNWYGSENSSKGSEVSLWKREYNDGGWQMIRLYTLLDNVFENNLLTPLHFNEKSDVEIRAISNLGGANVAAGFYGWFETNE